MVHVVSVVGDSPCTHISARNEKLSNTVNLESHLCMKTFSVQKKNLFTFRFMKEMGVYATDKHW